MKTVNIRKVLIQILLLAGLLLYVNGPVAAQAETENATEIPKNGIPLIVIRIDESEEAVARAAEEDPEHEYGTIDQMNRSSLHTIRCVGEVQIIVPDGFVGEYGSSAAPEDPIALKFIRGRGNLSWGLGGSKKSYKLKFMEAVSLFGMESDKEWALMSNNMDDTLLKNRITYWLGEETGLGWSPRQIPVDVVMIGSESGRCEMGSYTLCETIKVDRNRLSIPEPKKKTVSDDPEDQPNITGGYLLSVYDSLQDGILPDSVTFQTESGLEWQIKAPEYEDGDLTEGQQMQGEYIRRFMQETEDLILKSGEIDESEHAAIAARMDLESAADYWWIQTFSCNSDAFVTSSTYLYKTPDTAAGTGQLFWGPLWDFDMGWEAGDEEASNPKTGLNNAFMLWFDELRDKDPLFVDLLKERWNNPENGLNVKLEEITEEGGLLDRYAGEIRKSWAADYCLFWGADSAEAEEAFDQGISRLRNAIEQRRLWVSGHLDELDQVYFNITYIIGDQVYATESRRGSRNIINPPQAPEREGFVFTGWKEAESGESLIGFIVSRDLTFTAEYMDKSTAVLPEAAMFSSAAQWVSLSDGIHWSNLTILPEGISAGPIQWTSSNPEVAVTEDSTVRLTGIGETTITATLWNGLSGSYLLHVYDPETTIPVKPEGIAVDSSVFSVRAGETKQIFISMLPDDRPLESFGYSFSLDAEDPSFAEISSTPAMPVTVTGVTPGKTVVTVTARNPWEDGLPEFTAEFELIVTAESGDLTDAGIE